VSGWPQGFSAGVAHCGLKSNGDPELALISSLGPCAAAAVFTRNLVCAAPVQLCREILQQVPTVGGVLINSKNANAVTGPQGMIDARQLAQQAAQKCHLSSPMLVMSTGIIGQPMPMAAYQEGLERMQLGASPEQVARAMMTTDTYPKVVFREEQGTRWLGLAKGAGMIHPDMATLLALVITDANLPQPQMQAALESANDVSFHCITVDGDSSTNDSLLFLANARHHQTPENWPQILSDILKQLAQMVAFDGEGARHCVTLRVKGLADDAQARQLGRTVLTSPLVKTAIAGKDANWGRILAAAGRAGVPFDPTQASLHWNGLALLDQGQPTNPGAPAEQAAVQPSEVALELRLGSGPGQAELWSCDLTHDYISINGDYRS